MILQVCISLIISCGYDKIYICLIDRFKQCEWLNIKLERRFPELMILLSGLSRKVHIELQTVYV